MNNNKKTTKETESSLQKKLYVARKNLVEAIVKRMKGAKNSKTVKKLKKEIARILTKINSLKHE